MTRLEVMRIRGTLRKGLLIFNGEKDAYCWWLIYIVKHFDAVETSEENLGEAVWVVIGLALIWCRQWTLKNPGLKNQTGSYIQIRLLWQFKL